MIAYIAITQNVWIKLAINCGAKACPPVIAAQDFGQVNWRIKPGQRTTLALPTI